MGKKLLKPYEAADLLSVSTKTIYNMINRGEIDAVRMGPGNRIRIKPEVVQAYIKRRSGEATEE